MNLHDYKDAFNEIFKLVYLLNCPLNNKSSFKLFFNLFVLLTISICTSIYTHDRLKLRDKKLPETLNLRNPRQTNPVTLSLTDTY